MDNSCFNHPYFRNDSMLSVFMHVDYRDLNNLRLVNHRFKLVADDSRLCTELEFKVRIAYKKYLEATGNILERPSNYEELQLKKSAMAKSFNLKLQYIKIFKDWKSNLPIKCVKAAEDLEITTKKEVEQLE